MLRVNLLPPYIYEGAKRKKVGALWVVVILAVAAGFIGWKVKLGNDAAAINAQTESEQKQADDAVQMAKDAVAINDQSKTITEKATFVRDSRTHTTRTYPDVVHNVRDFTIRPVLYSSLDPAGQTVQLSAQAPSLSAFGQYVMWMEHNPKINNVSVALAGIPGFPAPSGFSQEGPRGAANRAPDSSWYNFEVTLTLKDPIPGAPTYGGTGGGRTGGASGGPGGPPMGMSGAPMMSGMSGAPMMSGMSGAPGNSGAPTVGTAQH